MGGLTPRPRLPAPQACSLGCGVNGRAKLGTVASLLSLVHKTNTRTDNTIKRNFDQLDHCRLSSASRTAELPAHDARLLRDACWKWRSEGAACKTYMLKLTPKFAHIPAEAFTKLVLAQVSSAVVIAGGNDSETFLARSIVDVTQTRSYSKPLSLGRRAQVSQASAAETSRPSAGSSWYDGSPDRLVPGHSYFVTCHPGLEEIVAAELSAQHIGAQEVIPGKAGVFFRSATKSAVCRVRKASPLTCFPVMIDTIAANDTRVWLLHRGTDVVGYRANLWLRSSIR